MMRVSVYGVTYTSEKVSENKMEKQNKGYA